MEGTRGSETSQYPQEEKTIVIPLVVASERGRGQTGPCVIAGGRCIRGVVGSVLSILPDWPTVRNHRVSRSGLERPVVEGENPVDENMPALVEGTRVAAGP